jgi:hypothetical protein
VEFLDCKVSILGRRLKTKVFTKPTDRKAYLHGRSYHPRSTIDSIAYSQATRLKRICSEDQDFWELAEKLKKDLVNRGHNESKVSEEINRAANVNREALLTYKEKTESNMIPLVVSYNKRLPNLKKILEESWSTLQINETEKAKFKEGPLVCYRKNKNLRDILGQTRISKNRVARKKHQRTGRCAPCRSRPDTKCCQHVVSTTYFTDQAGRSYDIRQRVGCKSRNAIYLAFCIKCNHKQYVGKVEKQGTNKRINKHRNDSKRDDSIAIDAHFREAGHIFNRDFRLIVIEEIEDQNMTKEQIRETLLRREDFWIVKLKTLEPRGFNDRLNFPSEA